MSRATTEPRRGPKAILFMAGVAAGFAGIVVLALRLAGGTPTWDEPRFSCRQDSETSQAGGWRECLRRLDDCERSGAHRCFPRPRAHCSEHDTLNGKIILPGERNGRAVFCAPTTEECNAFVRDSREFNPSVCRESAPDEVPADHVLVPVQLDKP